MAKFINGAILYREDTGRFYQHLSGRVYQIDDEHQETRGHEPKDWKVFKQVGDMRKLTTMVLNDDELIDKCLDIPTTPHDKTDLVVKELVEKYRTSMLTGYAMPATMSLSMAVDDAVTTSLGASDGTSSHS